MLTAGVPKPKPEVAVWDSKRKARTSNYNSTMICAPTLVLPLPPLSGEGGGGNGVNSLVRRARAAQDCGCKVLNEVDCSARAGLQPGSSTLEALGEGDACCFACLRNPPPGPPATNQGSVGCQPFWQSHIQQTANVKSLAQLD